MLDIKEKENPESPAALDWVAGEMAMSVFLLHILAVPYSPQVKT